MQATDGYYASVADLSQVSLAGDNVFGHDDRVLQVSTATALVVQGKRSRST